MASAGDESNKGNSGNSGSSDSSSKPSGNTGSTQPSGGSTGGSGSSGGQTTQPSQPQQPAHTHNWVAHYSQVDNGHYETTNTWVADAPLYEWRTICNKCGADCTDNPVLHSAQCGGGYSNVQVQTNVGAGHYEQSQHWVSNIQNVHDYDYCTGCGATR